MKVFERVLEARLRRNVVIYDMQFGFMPGRGTTDAIFIVKTVAGEISGKKQGAMDGLC